MPYKNPEDKIANDKVYREANRDKLLAQKKAYYRVHYEVNKEKMRAYYEANKEKMRAYYEANKETIKAYRKVWGEKNKGVINSRSRVYQAKKKQKDCITSSEDKQMAKWIYTTASKLTETTDIVWHVDHIKPLSKGGMHSLNNLQIVPAQWNLQKNNNNEERWNG